MKEKNKSVMPELMKYAGGRKYLTYLSWSLSAVSAVLALLPFVYIWQIIKEVIEVYPNFGNAENIVRNGWFAVIFSLASMIIYFAGLMCSHLSAFRVAANIRKTAMAHIASLPLGFIQETGTGKIRRIVNESSASTETYLAHELPDMAGAVATPLGMIVILFLFDWRFGLISLVPIVLGFISMMKMTGPAMARDMKNFQNAIDDMNNEAVEYIRGVPVVKTFGQTVFSFERFRSSIENYSKFCLGYTKKCRQPMLLFTTLINSAFAFLIVAAIVLSSGSGDNNALLLNLMFYTIFTPVIATTMNKVLFMSENTMLVRDALGRIHTIFDAEPLPDCKKPAVPRDNSVEFKDVTFRYPNASEDALKRISFTVKSGETVALVGPSGGGKTTAAELIARFRDVRNGEIKVGGINIKNMDKRVLADTVSYVFQNSKLLKASIFENVRLGVPNADKAAVLRALHLAQCDDIIAKLPNGIDTVIGTKGVYLSGGEQQRIAIARVILKNSPIIVLDEATAFADPENEALVQKAFNNLAENKTLIMIAHRLTTVRNADKIYVLESGKIAESGSHEQLLSSGGLYKKMWDEYQSSANWKVGV